MTVTLTGDELVRVFGVAATGSLAASSEILTTQEIADTGGSALIMTFGVAANGQLAATPKLRTAQDIVDNGGSDLIEVTGIIDDGPAPIFEYCTADDISALSSYTTSAVRIAVTGSSDEAVYENESLIAPDSPSLLFSTWLRNGTLTGRRIGYIAADEQVFWTLFFYIDHIEFDFYNAARDNHYLMRINGLTQLGDSDWHHVIASVDTNHPAHSKIGKLSFDGVAQTVLEGSDNGGAFNIGWTVSPAYVGYGQGFGGSGGNIVELTELWMGMGQYADASSAVVVEKFRDPVTGKPIYLGANGELPTGTSPNIYFKGHTSTFANPNLGTGGAFVQSIINSGTITNASTSPSD